jgi:hypothetical protein
MKRLFFFCMSLILFWLPVAGADLLYCHISGHGTNAVYYISDKAYPEALFTNTLARLRQAFSPDEPLYVRFFETNTVAEVTQLLVLIQDAGFKRVLYESPLYRGTGKGAQFLNLQLLERPKSLPSCLGDLPMPKDGFLGPWPLDVDKIRDLPDSQPREKHPMLGPPVNKVESDVMIKFSK